MKKIVSLTAEINLTILLILLIKQYIYREYSMIINFILH